MIIVGLPTGKFMGVKCPPGQSNAHYKSNWRSTWLRDVFCSRHLRCRASHPKHVLHPDFVSKDAHAPFYLWFYCNLISGAEEYFVGQIDEVRVYKTTLTPADFKSIYDIEKR